MSAVCFGILLFQVKTLISLRLLAALSLIRIFTGFLHADNEDDFLTMLLIKHSHIKKKKKKKENNKKTFLKILWMYGLSWHILFFRKTCFLYFTKKNAYTNI